VGAAGRWERGAGRGHRRRGSLGGRGWGERHGKEAGAGTAARATAAAGRCGAAGSGCVRAAQRYGRDRRVERG